MFNINQFIDDCKAAVQIDPTHKSVSTLMQKAFTDPAAVMVAVGTPTEGGLTPLYRSKQLTILNVVWKPGVSLMPHNHQIWAVIGIYTGREQNTFWRRIKDASDGRIEVAGSKTLMAGDVMPMGTEIIHSVSNPEAELCGAIHVYGGDYFDVERSEWDPQALTEHPCDMAKVLAFFNQK
jgi:predicted metal-dependent enzyme (double-stranded beta helix superfamily)